MNFKKIVASAVALASVVTIASCGGGRTENTGTSATTTTPAGTTTTPQTYDTDKGVQDAVGDIEMDKTINPTKKLKWMAWWPIDETSAEAELFKATYGIPEEGNQDYGEYADTITVYMNVAYNERYDKLASLVASGDSPDLFPFEIGYFPLSAYKGMFQCIDGIVDTTTEEWADTRDVMDQFMWGGKNYCPITAVNTAYLFWYRRSVVEEAGLQDPYELYKNGEWTWDKFLEMADSFQKSGEEKYICDGFYVSRSMLCTTGKPLIGITDGKLESNLNTPEVERAMSFLETLMRENYRYPISENSWQPNEAFWTNGNTLFFVDGTWFYEEKGQKYMRRYEWGEDDIFMVPAPRDPSSDSYYQEMKVDPVMFVAGSDNVDGFKAWTACVLAASKDEGAIAAQREKNKRDKYWTDQQLDFIDELKTDLDAIFDFRNGISTECADTTSGQAPTDRLIVEPYQAGEVSYVQLRAELEGEINIAIDTLNDSVA